MRRGARRRLDAFALLPAVVLVISATASSPPSSQGLPGTQGRGALGVVVNDVAPQVAAAAGLERPGGALIVALDPGGSAKRAGIRIGDIVLAVGDRAVWKASELVEAMAPTHPGETIVVKLQREQRAVDVTVLLDAYRADVSARQLGLEREARERSCSAFVCPECLGDLASLSRPGNVVCESCLKQWAGEIAKCLADNPPAAPPAAPASTIPPATPPPTAPAAEPAPAAQATRLTLHDVTIEPERVAPGGTFAIKVSYASPSSAPVAFAFSISVGGREVLAAKSETIAGTAGTRMLYTRSLIASSEPGSYVIHVRLSLEGRVIEDSATLTVAAK